MKILLTSNHYIIIIIIIIINQGVCEGTSVKRETSPKKKVSNAKAIILNWIMP